MKYILVEGGVVLDVAMGGSVPGDAWVPAGPDVQVGWELNMDDGEFHPPMLRWGLPDGNTLSAVQDAQVSPGQAWVMLPQGAQKDWTREDESQPWTAPVHRYAIHENNVVQNIALASEALSMNWMRIAERVSVGWWRVDEQSPWQPPEPPPEPVPASVTRRQGQLALLSYGLLDEAQASIAAIADPMQRRAAQIEYGADTWERNNAFLSAMWMQLGGTPETLDDAFRLAVTL